MDHRVLNRATKENRPRSTSTRNSTMSFPSEPIIIQPEEIMDSDIIIEDRKIVALDGNESAIQAINAAAKATFYSKLIVSLADSIRSKEKTDDSEWTSDTYKLATEKIINLVTKTKSSVLRRFVWFRQFPETHYVVMTRTQTINKLANDLDCQMRKVKAREFSEAQQASKQKNKPNERRFAQRLILKVCRAARRGMSPYQAVLLLDQPDRKVQESNRATSDWPKDEKEVGAAPVDLSSNNESELGRKVRLQLRHRFLAAVRSKKCIFDFANALLTMWGLPNTPKYSPKRKKKVVAVAAATSSPKSTPIPHNVGTWNRDERVAFWEGLETHGVPHWVKIKPYVHSRTHFQVTAFGRSIVKKFNLGHGDIRDNEDVREYLLRDD